MSRAAAIHLYRPQRTKPEDLEAVFVARESIVEGFLERLGRCGALASRQHYLFIGPRGIGKTCLLEVIQHRIRAGALGASWVPVALAEEGYAARSVANLLLEGLQVLANQTGDAEAGAAHARLRHDADDQRVTDLALDAFRSFHKRLGKRVLLLVENVNRVLDRQLARNGQQIALLRKILIEEDWLVMIGTSPTYVSAATEPEAPLFEFFQVTLLQELSREEQVSLFRKLAALEDNETIHEYLRDFNARLQALYHFTGGNPRLALMLYDLIAHKRIFDVQEELDGLLDQLTPFYQDRMRDLADQEAQLLERMALLPEGCTPTELAREARMEAKTVRALMTRLEGAGYVRREQRRKKQTVYIIPERFFRIWHQLNHSRAERGRVQYLLEFFATWYNTRDERDRVWKQLVESLEKRSPGAEESQVNEIVEFMDYIAAVSIGQEKYDRQFETIYRREKCEKSSVVSDPNGALEGERDSDANYLVAKGRFFARELHDNERACMEFEEAVLTQPSNLLAHYNLVAAFDKAGRHNEAEHASERVASHLEKLGPHVLDADFEHQLWDALQFGESPVLTHISGMLLGQMRKKSATNRLLGIAKNSNQSWRRLECANALDKSGSSIGVDIMLGLADDSDKAIRARSVWLLSRAGSEYSVGAIIKCLMHERADVRSHAAHCIGMLCALEQCADRLTIHKRRRISANREKSLLRMLSVRAVEPLVGNLQDEIGEVRGTAAWTLGIIGQGAFQVGPISSLEEDSDQLRIARSRPLHEVYLTEVVPALLRMSRVETGEIRSAAVTALSDFAERQSVPQLPEIAQLVLDFGLDDDAGRVRISHNLLRSAFRSRDAMLIRQSLEVTTCRFSNGDRIFAPHFLALEFVDSDRDPAILERQQPEMREAAMLLVNLYDESAIKRRSVET